MQPAVSRGFCLGRDPKPPLRTTQSQTFHSLNPRWPYRAGVRYTLAMDTWTPGAAWARAVAFNHAPKGT